MYLPFSIPILFFNGFAVELSNFEANIEREREKDVEHNATCQRYSFNLPKF